MIQWHLPPPFFFRCLSSFLLLPCGFFSSLFLSLLFLSRHILFCSFLFPMIPYFSSLTSFASVCLAEMYFLRSRPSAFIISFSSPFPGPVAGSSLSAFLVLSSSSCWFTLCLALRFPSSFPVRSARCFRSGLPHFFSQRLQGVHSCLCVSFSVFHSLSFCPVLSFLSILFFHLVFLSSPPFLFFSTCLIFPPLPLLLSPSHFFFAFFFVIFSDFHPMQCSLLSKDGDHEDGKRAKNRKKHTRSIYQDQKKTHGSLYHSARKGRRPVRRRRAHDCANHEQWARLNERASRWEITIWSSREGKHQTNTFMLS